MNVYYETKLMCLSNTNITYSHVEEHDKRFASDTNDFILILSLLFHRAGLAHMLGTERSGQLLDEVTDRVLEGRQVTCEQKSNTWVLK